MAPLRVRGNYPNAPRGGPLQEGARKLGRNCGSTRGCSRGDSRLVSWILSKCLKRLSHKRESFFGICLFWPGRRGTRRPESRINIHSAEFLFTRCLCATCTMTPETEKRRLTPPLPPSPGVPFQRQGQTRNRGAVCLL